MRACIRGPSTRSHPKRQDWSLKDLWTRRSSKARLVLSGSSCSRTIREVSRAWESPTSKRMKTSQLPPSLRLGSPSKSRRRAPTNKRKKSRTKTKSKTRSKWMRMTSTIFRAVPAAAWHKANQPRKTCNRRLMRLRKCCFSRFLRTSKMTQLWRCRLQTTSTNQNT